VAQSIRISCRVSRPTARHVPSTRRIRLLDSLRSRFTNDHDDRDGVVLIVLVVIVSTPHSRAGKAQATAFAKATARQGLLLITSLSVH
jgi:hypothetical protein